RFELNNSTPTTADALNPLDRARQLALLQDARSIAQERAGRVLADTVENTSSRLLWECSQGHQWTARFMKVKTRTWCPECAGKRHITIEEMQQIAAQRGGRCLSTEYVNNAIPLQWRCAEHHTWWAAPVHIRRNWCAVCARCQKLELKDLRNLARSRH